METFNKAIKKLSEEEYLELLKDISERKESKVHQVLESARLHNYDDSKMMEILAVNSSTYYTLKSRLKTKLSELLSKKLVNPIATLMNEVARVPANLYGANQDVSIRALKELEKKLLEYDLVNELIVVYKTLSWLHIHNYDYEYYQKLYTKYVAYSLAVVKAENHFYNFFKKASLFYLSFDNEHLETLKSLRREMSNIVEMYDSHRMFVLFNIINIYYECLFTEDIDKLRLKEIEIDEKLQEINEIFNKYSIDTFYLNNRILVDYLYFEFYLRTKNPVRADFYLKKIEAQNVEVFEQHILHFQTIIFLYGKLSLFNLTKDTKYLLSQKELIEGSMDIEKDDVFSSLYYRQYLALVQFYLGEYRISAKMINDMRNEVNLRNYMMSDVQLKLIQSLQYALLGDEELASQLTNSVKRQTSDEKDEFPALKHFLKFIGNAIKPGEYKKKMAKSIEIWKQLKSENKGEVQLFQMIELEDKHFKLLSEPYK